ncbi:hypothetical protein IW261DRAFT_1551551 [Armillaria novae-zelandiae]|uniref:Reverse transcriptase zinc-binding domain-containing protein n=1 Tax=Armillaria novae-zelandiae TaxID=153914 RepID=A0AA39P857_9AGAR|nr:hypothetical protein IW261DRAFT_1551551 [Armillaria novae-zelandiae]
MTLHDGYVVGRHWKHINGCEDRIECRWCGTEESMDHILTQCDAPGQKEKTKTDLVITKGLIMSCGIQPPSVRGNRTKKGTERFHRILISESAHLIWKMRNDRVINNKDNYTMREIEQRWLHAMNCRMRLDCLLSDQQKFARKAIKKFLVLTTWQGALLNESSLQDDWTKDSGVLVGIVK